MVFEETPIGILTCDINGKILQVNKEAIRILNSPSKEATLAINLLAFPPLVQAGLSEDIRNCLKKLNRKQQLFLKT